MGRKTKYSSDAERQKAYRDRHFKQKQPSKLSNQERLEIAKVELGKLTNPSRNEAIYTLCLNQGWNRTLSTEVINMLELNEKTVFTEKPTEQAKSERDEIAECIHGKNGKRDEWAIDAVMSLPQADRDWLKEWHKYGGNGKPPEIK